MFEFNEKDFIFSTNWNSLADESEFDRKLKSLWQEKNEKGLFRYKYNVESLNELSGKYRFIAALNTDRGTKRRKPITFASVTEPFNNDLFNFTKINPEEYLFKFRSVLNNCSSNSNDILAINASPLGDFHSLILPKINNKLPQIIDEYSLRVSIQLLLLSASPAIRVGYNSLCGFASVNHLHLHLYYLPHKMYLESCDLMKLSGPCHTIMDYPSKGFVFILKKNDDLFNFIGNVFLLIHYLQKKNIPHNLYITRALMKELNISCDTRNCIRLYIWARTSSGDKDMNKFTPATCELFGHLVLKDKSEFSEVSESNISQILNGVTESSFLSIKNDVKNLYL